jgi:hypothetical protein
MVSVFLWRREQDSNLRYHCWHTRFPSVRLQPLGHLSKLLSYSSKDCLIHFIFHDVDSTSVYFIELYSLGCIIHGVEWLLLSH